MLHWRPDLVDMSQAAPGKPHQTGGSFPTNPMPYQPPFDQNVISVRITAEEMLRGHESGISGDATVADADKGRRVLEAIVRNTARHRGGPTPEARGQAPADSDLTAAGATEAPWMPWRASASATKPPAFMRSTKSARWRWASAG